MYVLKAVFPNGKKIEWVCEHKKNLESMRKTILEMGFLRATIKKRKEKNEK